MALDYQKTMYRHSQKVFEPKNENKTRTSYNDMHHWQTHVSPNGPKVKITDKNFGVHLNYGKSGGYDDFHKTFQRMQLDNGARNGFPTYGPPRLRNGKGGGSWRHVRNVLQAEGSRTVFVDGTPAINDITHIRMGRVEDADTIYPINKKSDWDTAKCDRYLQEVNRPKQYGMNDLAAFKSTEKGNWLVMR